MRYVYDENEVIMIVEDDDAVIQTKETITSFATQEEAIEYFIENGIDYSILIPQE